MPGDNVDLEVMEYHEGSSGYGTTSTPQANMINMIAAAFGGVSGGQVQVAKSTTVLIPQSVCICLQGNPGDSRPAAYLNYILVDKNYQMIDMGWQLAPAATFTKQELQFSTINIKCHRTRFGTDPGVSSLFLAE